MNTCRTMQKKIMLLKNGVPCRKNNVVKTHCSVQKITDFINTNCTVHTQVNVHYVVQNEK